MFAIKTKVDEPRSRTFTFSSQKTMYGGKKIAAGDTIFIFASENEGAPASSPWAGSLRRSQSRECLASSVKLHASASSSGAPPSPGARWDAAS